MKDIYKIFVNPPNEFSQLPWWFWNDEITEDGIKQQLAEFRRQGIYGFTIQARMGLSKDIPYLGVRWFELVKFAVDEAEKYGMIVHLYDEGMYPSGSAHGEVVKGHPEFLAHGLEMRKIESSELKLDEQEKCIAILLEYAFIITPSNGTIRGVHEGEEDGQPYAPKAADLLNPLAMKRFIELTHDRYYSALKDHFGKTVQAMFTDEPSLLGRGAKRGLKAWTDGFEEYFLKEKGYDIIPLLPELWNNVGGKAERDYQDVIAKRFNESFYHQISDWCAEHNIALTGHPSASDDICPLRYFQLPGQDMVWRYVEPEKPSALEGAHSTVGKCSSSSARHLKARRNGNEVYGAYGWNLNMDEMKWLADWFMVRGVNLFWTHAFYYSMRDFRAYERPPDLGINNLWWEHYHIFAEYTKRLCWLLTDSTQVCDVAILAHHNHLPWEPAKALFQNQIDFNYLEDRLLSESVIENGKLNIGESSYPVIVRMKGHLLAKHEEDVLSRFINDGGCVLEYDDESSFISDITRKITKDVVIDPVNVDLRYIHVKRDGYDFYYLTNEGGKAIDGKLTLNSMGHAEWWDPLTGKNTTCTVLSQNNASISVPLHLDEREGIVIAIDPNRQPILNPNWQSEKVSEGIDISDGWRIYDPDNKTLANELVDWVKIEGYEKFSGTLLYEKTLEISDGGLYLLSIGEVHDFAEVYCNDEFCGIRLWKPFRFNVSLKSGVNKLIIKVTNSMANRMANMALKSGMFEPIMFKV